MTVLLTTREQQVLGLIATGCTNREIASSLTITESTVENHIHSIYLKLGVTKRVQAARYAFQSGITPLQNLVGNRGNPPSHS